MSASKLRTHLYSTEAADRPHGVTLHCAGEIDLGNIDCLKLALSTAVATGVALLDVDLRDVEYLDSCTIRVLLDTRRELSRDGRVLRLQASPRIARLFCMLGLDADLEVRTPKECRREQDRQ